jgi:hypothetical protein
VITADSHYRGICRISRDKFARLIRERANPDLVAERPAEEYWDAIMAQGCDPLFVLRIFKHESGYGTAGVALLTHSWGNTRQPSFGAQAVGLVPGRTGQFPVFANWLEGAISTAARLTTSEWYYAKENRTIGGVFIDPLKRNPPIEWAPAGDLNDPNGYLAEVLAGMNADADMNLEAPVARSFHLALSYGLINTSGGDALEKEQTPLIGTAVRDACRARGLEVRVVQDERGAGLSLDGVAQTVVDWHQAGWPVDLYLEVHTEGGGRGGVFGIYPDWDGDYDADAERIARDAATRISAAVPGLGVRGGGAMSERNTGVGGQGFRLGIFRVTEPLKATSTRLIIEYGAHDIDSDYRAVMANIPGCANATAEAFASEALRLGYQVGNPAPVPQPVPVPPIPPAPDLMDFGHGIVLLGGFLAYWRGHDGERTLGPPTTNEIDYDDPTSPAVPANPLPGKRRVQRFQKGALIWLPELPHGYQVQELSIDTELFRKVQAA